MSNLTSLDLQRLSTCHDDLQRLVQIVSDAFSVLVIVGHRDQIEQHQAYISGHSEKDWPDSKHNGLPSKAVDIAPRPYNPNDLKRLYLFAGYVLGTAKQLEIHIRYGGDWSGALDPSHNKFNDLWHFELI